jgi:hypothetical protein
MHSTIQSIKYKNVLIHMQIWVFRESTPILYRAAANMSGTREGRKGRRQFRKELLLVTIGSLTIAWLVILITPRITARVRQDVIDGMLQSSSGSAEPSEQHYSLQGANRRPKQQEWCENRLSRPWMWWERESFSANPVPSFDGRFFVSTFPERVTDGIGHMSSVVAWELAASRLLQATYIHRDALYGSLQTSVDEFFDWRGGSETRTSFFSKNCMRTEDVQDSCGIMRTGCAVLNRSGSALNRIVKVPEAILRCAVKDQRAESLRTCGLTDFLHAHDGKGVLFQLDYSDCFWKHSMIWHGTEMVHANTNYWRKNALATFPMNPKHIHIAIHIRRGDIIPSNQTDSKSKFVIKFSDRAIVKILSTIMLGIEKAEKDEDEGRKPTTKTNKKLENPMYEVHIFSQGARRSGVRIWSNHRLDAYPGGYVNEFGVEQDSEYWSRILRSALPSSLAHRVHVTMRISADTLKSIATMASSDVFVATKSALGNSLVRGIARGVQLQSATDLDPSPNVVHSPTLHLGDVDMKSFVVAWKLYRTAFEACGGFDASHDRGSGRPA